MDVLIHRDLDTRHVKRPYEQALEQLRRGDFRSAEVKKLRGAGIFRARLDDKNRLLFKLGEHRGRRVVLVLEVVRNHAYDKARFLNGGSWTEGDFAPLEAAAPEALPAERLAYVHPSLPELHVLDKPLSFDDAQAAVFEAPLPLIVVGSAGSGKTALTLLKLRTLAGRGLYLTRSSFLVENARALYYAHHYANEGQEVEFLSLAELVETIDVPRGREATWGDFAAWYARMRGTFKLREPHRIFEEIQGVLSGAAEHGPWMTEDEYLGLGVRQSIFLGDERREVLRVVERWRAHLKQAGLFDANVAAWERCRRAAPTYDFLVIDEVQDVTLAQLRLALATLRDRRSFLLCGDSNQIVHPNLFCWSRVKSLFYVEPSAPGSSPLDRIHVLAANYRNTQAVTELANRLLRVKQCRFGSIDRESNFLVECASDERGAVALVADSPEIRREIEEKTRRSTRYAVVVLRDEDKAAARAAFSTPLVFSIREAKGLEYDNVVLLGMVSGAAREFRECAEGVAPADLDGELFYSRGRDKTDKSLDAYKFYINAIYVGLTRAMRSVLVVERETAHPLYELLGLFAPDGRVELVRDESSHEEWQREARRLELQGKTEQAEQIRREILGCEPVPWPVTTPAALPELRARALGPGPRDKQAQQRLFEYALTYDMPALLDPLVQAGFRHAAKPDTGRRFIEQTHYIDYRYRKSPRLAQLLRRHGTDFRNPLNETPLMVAARMGLPETVADLLGQGANPELLDSGFRSALRVALAGWLDRRGVKANAFEQVYRALATAPIKVRVGSRMTKLDPNSMEWFLLHLCLVHYPRIVPSAINRRLLPAFNAAALVKLLISFPPGVLAPYRRKRPYVSSILAKNEVGGSSPYNRRLFYRAARGFYVLNPALEVEVQGRWVCVTELMGLPALLLTYGVEAGSYLGTWFESFRTVLAQRFGGADREPATVGAPGSSAVAASMDY